MKQKLRALMTFFVFPAALIYYEAVLRLSVFGSAVGGATVYAVLFSIAYGILGYLLAGLTGKKWVNYAITLALILLTAVPYLVQYFVYRQFNVFYDLNTMLSGASDAVTDYSGILFSMIFSIEGISRIVLFLLPTVLYAIFGRFAVPEKASWKRRIACVCLLAAAWGGSLWGISRSSALSLVFGKEYHYQTAVEKFGLITAMGLDLTAMDGEGGGFEYAEPVTVPTAAPTEPPTEPTVPPTQTTQPPTEPPVVYTPNMLDIDYASLKAEGTIAELNAYVASLEPTMKNEYTGLFAGKNLIFITAEAFAGQVIDAERTPTLYRLATKGIQFTDFYQPSSAGTTGGEYQNLFGMLPTKGGESLKKTDDQLNYFTMGNQLDRLGYFGKAYHNHNYRFYDRHETHNNLGYSEGFMGYGNGMGKYLTDCWPESDMEMFVGTVAEYIDHQPFNIYYMTVSGHSGYSPNSNAMTKRHWDRVKDLDYSDTVKGYFAAQMELEDSLAYLVGVLEEKGIADDTVICIATDHFPYGLDENGSLGRMPYLSELYGENVTQNLQRDQNRLILWCGSLEEQAPMVVDTPTSSLDILPTLSNLFGTEFDSRLMVGRDVFSDAPALVFNMQYDWKTEYGTYTASSDTFVPSEGVTVLPEGYVESIKAVVRNKMRYCQSALNWDYFGYLFGE